MMEVASGTDGPAVFQRDSRLYDRVDVIPFDRLQAFFEDNLK